jgi:hypothetical protein
VVRWLNEDVKRAKALCTKDVATETRCPLVILVVWLCQASSVEVLTFNVGGVTEQGQMLHRAQCLPPPPPMIQSR